MISSFPSAQSVSICSICSISSILNDVFHLRIPGGSKEDIESSASDASAARSQVDQESSAILWEKMETVYGMPSIL